MVFTRLALPEVVLISATPRLDSRGFFAERFRASLFKLAGIPTSFPQENHSRSWTTVVRGLHYKPGLGKLVSVVNGCILDVAVDVRPASPTYGQHVSQYLMNPDQMLWIPPGFAHGFQVVKTADVIYRVTEEFDGQPELGYRWDSPDLGIEWITERALVSERDRALPEWRRSE